MPRAPSRPPARLALDDGSVFEGVAFGDLTPRTIDGEVCFNTSLTGYQEILTDPSYAGQIITMTCPQIGNYGVNEIDLESAGIHARGFVVRELSHRVSNFRADSSLEEWLERNAVTGIEGIDTRALTRKLRVQGAMNGVLSTDPALSHADLHDRAVAAPGLVGIDLVKTVSRSEPGRWSEDLGGWAPIQGPVQAAEDRLKIVAIDCGAKHNILRHLVDIGAEVAVLPYTAPPEQILEHGPDGLFVSNGPGDPAAVGRTIENLAHLRGKLPIFGICLGHQLLSHALGARTYKLRFGHRGGNHPVQNLHTGKVEITSQNHGFAVDIDSLEQAGATPTHINLNDRTLEGFHHREEPVFAVQYHPEASPGPHDARYLFDCFREMIRTGVSPGGEAMDTAQRTRNRVEQNGNGS